MNTIPQIQTVFCLLFDWLYSDSSGNDKSILSQIINMFPVEPINIKQMILSGGPKISVNMRYLIYKYILGPDAPAEIIPFYKSNVDKFYNRETQAQEPQSAKDFLRKFMQIAPMTADYGDKIPRLEAQYYDNSHDYCLTTLEQYYNHGKTNSDPATLLEYIQTRILVHMVPPEKVSEFSFETEFGTFQSPSPNTIAPTIENQILGAKDLNIFDNQMLEQLNTPYEIFLTESVKNLSDKSELLGSSGFTCSSNLLCSIYQHYSNNHPTSFLTYKQDGTVDVFNENGGNEIRYYILGEGYDQSGGYVCWGPAGSKRNSARLSNNTTDQLPTYGWSGFFSQRLQVDNFKDNNDQEFQIISYQASYQDIFGLSFQSFILKKIGNVLNYLNTLMPPTTTAPNDLQNNLTTIITNLTTIFNLEISEQNINQIVTLIASIDFSQNINQVITDIVAMIGTSLGISEQNITQVLTNIALMIGAELGISEQNINQVLADIALMIGTSLGISEEYITNFTYMIASIDFSQNINQVLADIALMIGTLLGIPEQYIYGIISVIATIDFNQNISHIITNIALMIGAELDMSAMIGAELDMSAQNIMNTITLIANIDYSQNITQVLAEIVAIVVTSLGIPEQYIYQVLADIALMIGTSLGIPEQYIYQFITIIANIDYSQNITQVLAEIALFIGTSLGIPEQYIYQFITIIANVDYSQNINQVLTNIALMIGSALEMSAQNIINTITLIANIDYSQNITQVLTNILAIVGTQLGIFEQNITQVLTNIALMIGTSLGIPVEYIYQFISIGMMVISINSDELTTFVINIIRDPLNNLREQLLTAIGYLQNTTITELFQLSNVLDSIKNINNNLELSNVLDFIRNMINTNSNNLREQIMNFIIVLTTDDVTLEDVGISNDDVSYVINIIGQTLNLSTGDMDRIQSLLFLLINNNILQMFGVTENQLINFLSVIFNILDTTENVLSEISIFLDFIIEFSDQSLINILDLILPTGTSEQIISFLQFQPDEQIQIVIGLINQLTNNIGPDELFPSSVADQSILP